MAAFIYKQSGLARTVFCLVLAAFSLCFFNSAHAQSNPVYTVEGVEVDVTAKSAVAAREKALEEAQVKAYQMLAERLLGPEELKTFQAPDANTVSLLVQDFEVTNEQLSRVRYKGTYTIRFRPNAMKSQMASQGRNYSDVQKKPVLVLPFYQASNQVVLWGASNPWMNAWRMIPTDRSLLHPTVLPLGDATDMADIGDHDVMDYNPVQLQEMATRYNADDAVILLAIPEIVPAGKRLNINVYKHGFEGPAFVQKVVIDPVPAETEAALYTRAAMKVKSILRQDWKANAAYNPTAQPATHIVEQTVQPMRQQPAGPATTYNTYARFASVQDWVRLKNTLDRTYDVQAVMVKTLKPREALLDVRFAGNINQLQNALQNSGIMMRATSVNAPIEIYMNNYQTPYRQ